MAELFKSSEDLANKVYKAIEDAGLASYGIPVEVMSTTKSKHPMSVYMAGSKAEYLTNTSGMICVELYEKALEMLEDSQVDMVIEMFINGISYNSEKDKIQLQTNQLINLFDLYRKYGNTFMNAIEAAYHAIRQIEEDEKTEKEDKKAEKKAKRQGNNEMD